MSQSALCQGGGGWPGIFWARILNGFLVSKNVFFSFSDFISMSNFLGQGLLFRSVRAKGHFNFIITGGVTERRKRFWSISIGVPICQKNISHSNFKMHSQYGKIYTFLYTHF